MYETIKAMQEERKERRKKKEERKRESYLKPRAPPKYSAQLHDIWIAKSWGISSAILKVWVNDVYIIQKNKEGKNIIIESVVKEGDGGEHKEEKKNKNEKLV
eukprot:TRINITY_DN1689_c1_g1_i1.p1 TRINITY_DN1689_c1_g1~~TRINITY_DN1689_c1_g1_i1.p1  ORF type:complete len:102 (+),score=14.26 TRINITY_DN1689_c1_g1_i1:687-992(+)